MSKGTPLGEFMRVQMAPAGRWVGRLGLTITDWSEPSSVHNRPLDRATFLPVLRSLNCGRTEEACYARYGDGILDLVRNSPRLDTLTLCLNAPPIDELSAEPLAALRELGRHGANRYAVPVLAADPSLTNLRTLRMCPRVYEADGDGRLTLSDLTAIAESPHLRNLTELRFSMTDMGDAAADVLIGSGLLFRLEVLDLSYGSLTDAGATAMAAALSGRPHRLRPLTLYQNGLTAAGLSALASTGVAVVDDGWRHEPGDTEYLFCNGDME